MTGRWHSAESGLPDDLSLGSAIADAHGLWIGGPNSLHLARPDGAILRVFDGSVYPAKGCF